MKLSLPAFSYHIKKIVQYALSLFFSSLFLLLISLLFLTLSNTGFNVLLTNIQDFSSGQFQFETVNGNLSTDVKISGIKYRNAEIAITIKNIHLNWQVSDLLQKKVTLNALTLSGIEVQQLSNTKQQTQALADITLPIDIIIKQFTLSNARIIGDDNSPPLEIQQIILSADFIKNQLNLHHFSVSLANTDKHIIAPVSTEVSLQGTIKLLVPYSFALQTKASINTEQLNLSTTIPLQIHGEVKGNLAQLHLSQVISGPLATTLEVQVTELLDHLQWQADIVVSHLPLQLILPEQAALNPNKVLVSTISASGDTQQGKAIITNHLLEYSRDIAKGKTPYGEVKVDLALDWRRAAIKWQSSIKTLALNPTFFHPDWPGSLSLDLQSEGLYSNDSLQATLQLNHLSGQLRGQALAGTGKFSLAQNALQIEQFLLSSGEAQIKADGQLILSDAKSQLNWSINIPQLSDLLADAQGQVRGKGQIHAHYPSGKALNQTPEISIQGKVKINDLSYQQQQLKQAELQVNINSNPDIVSNIDFQAQALALNSELIDNIRLQLSGPMNQQHINISLAHQLAKVTLNATGQLNSDSFDWSGQINALLIEGKQLGQWQQQTPAKLLLSKEKLKLSELCLKEITVLPNSVLCSRLNLINNKGKLNLNLKQFSLARLKPYLSEEVQQLSGILSSDINLDLGESLLAQLNASISPGELVINNIAHSAQPGQESISLPHRKGFLNASYTQQQFEAQWNIELGSHSIDGGINIPRKAIEQEPMKAPLNGQLNITIKDLQLLSIMVPQISEANGSLFAQLAISGFLDAPEISGQANFKARSLSIRDAGIQLTDTQLTLQAKNNGKALALTGNLHSGEGQLQLEGLISLDATQGWPVTINLQGDNFLAVNIPEAYAIISPDIQFQQQHDLLQLSGKIFIPEASIIPNSIPEGSVSISDDVVVLGQEKASPLNMNLDITLALGEQVTLDAFGLKSHLSGELSLNQQARQLLTAHGELHLKQGTFRAYGQDLNIDKGSIFYAGGYINNPGLKLSASRQVTNTRVGIQLSGTAKKPKFNAFSDDPSLENKDIIAMMLTGQKTDNLDNARIYAGTELGDGLSVGVNAGMGDEGSEFVTRYKLTEKIQVEGTSSATKSGGNIIYTFEAE